MYLQNGNVYKKGDLLKNGIRKVQKWETVVLRRIYIYISSTLKCSNGSSRLWWNWQFCKDLKIRVIPFSSIGLGRWTTTCRLIRLTPYACSPAIDGSVLFVVVRECIVVFGWVSAPRPILGGGRFFSTLLFPWSWIAESTACVRRFWWLSIRLEPSLGRTVEWCLDRRVSFMGLGLGSWIVMPCLTWSSSRQFTRYGAESISEWSLTLSVRDSWRWSILAILWAPVAVLKAAFCPVCIFLNLELLALVLQTGAVLLAIDFPSAL